MNDDTTPLAATPAAPRPRRTVLLIAAAAAVGISALGVSAAVAGSSDSGSGSGSGSSTYETPQGEKTAPGSPRADRGSERPDADGAARGECDGDKVDKPEKPGKGGAAGQGHDGQRPGAKDGDKPAGPRGGAERPAPQEKSAE
ncbi:hypothetical protein [Aeromicrobium stalagmiti]|uniref:hypothetical protein n=1 Tax=Aeromicrobium stalagmiti TaxID=2738988 RepID=UPI001569A55E|nr:hypothetical protein [Aeromicrobium stalagmiti]NRQ51190.1 hypothetical protein [Aeromicrobium stalagmiti]